MSAFTAEKIIFDLDGTLIDSAPDLHAATNHTLAHIDRPPVSLGQVRNMVGLGALKLIERGLAATGGAGAHDAKALLPVFLDYYGANITSNTVVYEGGVELLTHLADAGHALALCTNKPIGLTRPILENLGLAQYFEAVSGGDSFDFRKPDPRHLWETAALMRGDGPALMVGDSITDINAALAAKVPCVAVSFGYSLDPIHSLGADRVIDRLLELKDLVSRA